MAKDSKKVEPIEEVTEVTGSKVPAETTVSTGKPEAEWAIAQSASHHYSDMAKITAGLLVGVLALMVFLLSVGLQHPKPLIRDFLYGSFISLGLSLLLYQLGVMVEAKAHAKAASSSNRRSLSVVRSLQQLVFAIAVVATIGFAIAASQLFFVTAAAQSQAQTQTQAQ